MKAIFILTFICGIHASELVINSAELRAVNPSDVGLYFDLRVQNLARPNEALLFKILSKECCLEVTRQDVICDRRFQAYGGLEFGRIPAGQEMDVTVFWPTLVLYNRVGHCDIVLASTKDDGTKINLEHRLEFNTTVKENATMYPMQSFQGIKTCDSRDLNPIRSCEPENCATKYFGLRNFFNKTSQLCEPVPICRSSRRCTSFYDYTTNRCVPTKHLVTKADIAAFKTGHYSSFDWSAKVVKRNATEIIGSLTNDTHLRDALISQYMEYGAATFYTLYGLTLFVILASLFFCFASIMFCMLLLLNRCTRCCNKQQRPPAVDKSEYDKLQ